VVIAFRLQGAGFLAAVAAAVLLALPAPPADAAAYRPPGNKIFHGVSDAGSVGSFEDFQRQVRAHPALLQEFFHWDTPLRSSGALYRWENTQTLGVLSLSNAQPESGGSQVSPGAIARGAGDHYLVRLNESIGNWDKRVYIRLFPEMNGHWNPYCAFNANGSRRGGNHTTGDFKRAWRRIVIIIRGGTREQVNKRLRRQHMPRIYHAGSNNDPIYETEEKEVSEVMERPRVAFMWVPQTFGSPNRSGNQPRNYFPGGKYVDWVGADIFSKFSGAFDELVDFYRRYDNWPFVVGEYSPWDRDPGGRFTKRLFKFALSHHRVRALIYYRSVSVNNQYAIEHYPAARKVLRKMLNKRRFAEYGEGARGPYE
jgi:hypothetical protein